MASKMLRYDAEAREKLKKGVDKLANAVGVTLGPKGRNVVLEKSFGSPTITKDGVTVAKEVELEDEEEEALLDEVEDELEDKGVRLVTRDNQLGFIQHGRRVRGRRQPAFLQGQQPHAVRRCEEDAGRSADGVEGLTGSSVTLRGSSSRKTKTPRHAVAFLLGCCPALQ